MGNSKSKVTYHPVKVTADVPFNLFNIPPYIEGEFIWSYLSRLANANGIPSTVELLKMVNKTTVTKNWQRFVEWQYDLNRPSISNIITIDGAHWLLKASLYPYFNIFYSEGAKSNYVRSYSEEYSRDQKNKLITRPITNVPKVKLCPECAKHDSETGLVYLHTIHQMPGLNVCPIHGCRLLEYNGEQGKELCSTDDKTIDIGDRVTISKDYTPVEDRTSMDSEYAKFMKDLFDNPARCSAQDTIQALISCFEEQYNEKDRRKLADIIDDDVVFKGMEAELALARNILKTPNKNILPIPETVRLLLMFFGSYGGFLAHLDPAKSYKVDFLQHLGDEYELIGDYDENLVVVRCLRCGTVFPATPLSMILRIGCPKCNMELTNSEIFERMFSDARADGWRISEFKTMGTKATFRNESQNLQIPRITPLSFLFQKTMTDKYSHELPDRDWNNLEKCWSELERQVASLKGSLIFQTDLKLPPTMCSKDYCKAVKKNFMNDMMKQDKLVRMAYGVYYHTGEKHTRKEAIMSKYICRNGEYIGVPTDETLIDYIMKGYLPKNDLVFTTRKDLVISHNTLREIGLRVKLFSTEVHINEENWKKVAAFMTLKHLDFVKALPDDRKKKFRKWCQKLDITLEELVDYYGNGHSNFNVTGVYHFLREEA